MDLSGYMTIEASRQGMIEGSSLRKGKEAKINLFSFKHELHLPQHTVSGTANGPVVHKPITLVKEVDKSTPSLYQALTNKEVLSKVTLDWYRFNNVGEELIYYSMLLTDAHITSIAPWTPEPNPEQHSQLRFMETIQLVYDHITWSWGVDGDVTYETSWRGEN